MRKWVRVCKHQELPNTACNPAKYAATMVLGLPPDGMACAFSSILCGLKLVPAKRRCLVSPTRPHQGASATGNAPRWAADKKNRGEQYDHYPVINMTGQCEEAIHYYEIVFSTKADFILHYSDANPEDWKKQLSEAQKKYVYHAEMQIGNQRFMFSDIIEFDIVQGNNFFTVITFDTKEDVERIYNLMLPESKVLVPIHRTTYSSCTANLIDKYGIRWGLMTEQTEA